MLSREELRLIDALLNGEVDGKEKEVERLTKKIGLIVKQLDIMEKAQEETAKIQNEIVELDGGNNGKKKEK